MPGSVFPLGRPDYIERNVVFWYLSWKEKTKDLSYITDLLVFSH